MHSYQEREPASWPAEKLLGFQPSAGSISPLPSPTGWGHRGRSRTPLENRHPPFAASTWLQKGQCGLCRSRRMGHPAIQTRQLETVTIQSCSTPHHPGETIYGSQCLKTEPGLGVSSVSLALICLPNLTSVEDKETPVQCVTCSHTVVPWNLRGRDRREKAFMSLSLHLSLFSPECLSFICLCTSSFPTPSSSGRWAGCAFILEQCLQQSWCPGKCPVRSGSQPFVPVTTWKDYELAALESLGGTRVCFMVLCVRDLMWRRECGKVFVRTGQGSLAQKAGNCG